MMQLMALRSVAAVIRLAGGGWDLLQLWLDLQLGDLGRLQLGKKRRGCHLCVWTMKADASARMIASRKDKIFARVPARVPAKMPPTAAAAADIVNTLPPHFPPACVEYMSVMAS